ncbi:MAG: DUF3472 domain-containing protein [Phycisphaerales bacterium]|nr:DUF3472 domain-containing protein [Phycisphaerales bacterium]
MTTYSLVTALISAVLASAETAAGQAASAPASLEIPAFAAYCEPNADGMRFEDGKPVSGWRSADDRLAWYGELLKSGTLSVSIALHLPPRETATFRMRIGEQSREARIEGSEQPVTVAFGDFTIPRADYYRFELTGVTRSGETFGRIETLNLGGQAAAQARFNLKPRRNAASVHLSFPTDSEQVEWYYNELTVRTDPVHSFYMACGFHRGYFGIQVNSVTGRRIIFSVWDAGNEANDRGKVRDEDRVKLLAKGEGVVANDFGGEGTGGHSHLVFDWKTGQTYRFLLTAEPDGDATVYAAYFYFPARSAWGLIARFRAPKDGKYLRGLHSFNENFWGSNGQLQRMVEIGPPWIRTVDEKWHQLTHAKFTHDPTGRDDRRDYGAGVVNGRFYLSNGGFTKTPLREGKEEMKPTATKYGDTVDCPSGGKPPENLRLP